MSLNRVRDLWQAGKVAYGVIVTMPSPQIMQMLARAGFDWLLIDLEHGVIDLTTAHAMILATGGTPAVPMARIAVNAAWLAKPLLDAGVLGINMPMVNTKAEATAAGRAVRYPPHGDRMWGPFYAPLRWDLPMREYMHAANEAVISIITIEHIDAVRNIDEILDAPGIDLAVIGPGDLATSLGHYAQPDHPDVLTAIRQVEHAVLKRGIPLGGPAFTANQANRMADAGYRLIGLGFDWTLVQRGAAAVFDGITR
jgi:4-hydroxy-2-oxoheptanedioate aldolase